MSTLVTRLAPALLALVTVFAVQASPVDAAGRVRPYHVNGRFGLDTNLRTASGWSAWAIDEWLARETPLRGLGSAFMHAERRYDVNARYLVAHAMHESDNGTSFIARSKHNLFGYNAYDRDPSGAATRFRTEAKGIDAVAAFVDRAYLSPSGRWWTGAPTLRGMHYYASDPHWGKAIVDRANKMTIDSLTRRGIRFATPTAASDPRVGATLRVAAPYTATAGTSLPRAVTFAARWTAIDVTETRTIAAGSVPKPAFRAVKRVGGADGVVDLAIPAPPVAGRWRLELEVRDSDGARLPDKTRIPAIEVRVRAADEVVLSLDRSPDGLGVWITNTGDHAVPAAWARPATVAGTSARSADPILTAFDAWAFPLDSALDPVRLGGGPLASDLAPGGSVRFTIDAPRVPSIVVVRVASAPAIAAAQTVPLVVLIEPAAMGSHGAASTPSVEPITVTEPASHPATLPGTFGASRNRDGSLGLMVVGAPVSFQESTDQLVVRTLGLGNGRAHPTTDLVAGVGGAGARPTIRLGQPFIGLGLVIAGPVGQDGAIAPATLQVTYLRLGPVSSGR